MTPRRPDDDDIAADPASVASTMPPQSRPLQGALWMLLAAVTFTLAMSLVKFLGTSFPPTVQTFCRQVVSLLVLLPFILRAPRRVLRTSRPGYMLSRSAASSVALILSYTSYQQLGLAQANALSFTRILFMVPLAMLILGERVATGRLIATLVGFAGVVVVLQPWSAHTIIGWGAAAGIAAALLASWALVGVKSMTKNHGQMTLLAWSAVLGAIFTAPAAALDWATPRGTDLLLLCLLGLLSTVTQACYIRGMSMGDATALAPIDYTRIVFASAFGFAFFGEVPGGATLAGAAIIVAAALFITFHSRRRAAQAAAVIAETA